MTGFESKRKVAQAKLDDETRWDVDEDNPDSLAKHPAFRATQEQQAEPPPEWPLIKNILAVFGLDAIAFVAEWKAAQQQAEPVAHVLFRQDDDGLEPIMFYSPKTAPDPRTLKDRFVLKDVWLSPPPQRPWVGLTDEEILSTDPWEILRADPWMGTSDSNINPYQILLKVRTLEAKLKERNT